MAKAKKYEITITVDTNDADYNTSVNEISAADLKKIKPLLKAIKENKNEYHHNYGNSDFTDDYGPHQYPEFDKEIHEIFMNFCPYGEHGFHTIESVKYCEKPKYTRLL